MKSLWELVNNSRSWHHPDGYIRLYSPWCYEAHVLFSLPVPWWFSCTMELEHHGLPEQPLTPESLVGNLLPSSGWSLGVLLCIFSAPAHSSAAPLHCQLRYICLTLSSLYHALPKSFPAPQFIASSLYVLSTSDRAWHWSTHFGDI